MPMTIRLYTELSGHFADIAEVVHIFFPEAEVLPGGPEGAELLHTQAEDGEWVTDTFALDGEVFRWTTRVHGGVWERKRLRKRGLKQACFYLLRKKTGLSPPWGSLTGIRPTRLFYERLSRGERMQEAREALCRLYALREDKAQLLEDTVNVQMGLPVAHERAIDLYVGIPFCTTRCSYCSFFAEALGKGKKVSPYLAALSREMDAAARIIDNGRYMLRAIYIGGGTPTALSAEQLTRLLAALRERFPTAGECTVEAGRPDTIDQKKLGAMREAGVTRISINPQTMNDDTLRAIGRAHTAEDAERAFALARSMGMDNINMDIIAALPGEGAHDFEKTLQRIARLAPDSLTVHTLARKHGSRLNEFGFTASPGETAEKMVTMGAEAARAMGMRPYYLYRQKYVSGNLENVAYAKAGMECLYNVDIMEETTSVLAIGAGAISKRVFPRESRIERAPNARDVGHYIARVDEMIEKKNRLFGGE